METLSRDIDVQKLLTEAVQLDRVEYTAEMERVVRLLSREKTTRPLILVSSGTAGKVAGAEQTLLEIESYLHERQEDAEVARTGCLGMCSAEPVVSIQLPGRTRLFFSGIYCRQGDFPAG